MVLKMNRPAIVLQQLTYFKHIINNYFADTNIIFPLEVDLKRFIVEGNAETLLEKLTKGHQVNNIKK